ncbi:MAG: hypothetical protein AB1568_05840 [Thermodesulfobacteriota bacterium]
MTMMIRTRALRLSGLLLALVLTLPAITPAAVIEGIVFSRNGPAADAVVRAFADVPALIAGRPAAVSTAADKPGHYHLELPPGRYFLTAVAGDGKDLFAYHGINPLEVEDGSRWLPFFVVEQTPVTTGGDFQGISGQVLYKGKPLKSGSASVYPASDRHFRGMGLLTNTLDEEGRFYFDLEPGSYVVVARHHRQGGEMGPIRRGDLFCYPAANPVTVAAGRESRLAVECYPRDDLADFLDVKEADPRGRKETQRRASSFWQQDISQSGELPEAYPGGPAQLSGTVVDPAGRPQPGLIVTAYSAEEYPLFQMYVLRLISPHITRTDAGGNFRLALPGGSYYLVARENLGAAPDQGERYGLYEGSANHSIAVAAGRETTGATITVGPIMP